MCKCCCSANINRDIKNGHMFFSIVYDISSPDVRSYSETDEEKYSYIEVRVDDAYDTNGREPIRCFNKHHVIHLVA